MKGLQQWAAVQELYKLKVPKAQIAKQLGMSRNTVKRLLLLKEKPQYHREHYSSKLDDFKEQIIQWRCEPFEFNGTRIFRELGRRGYTGSIGPVYRFLAKVDEDVGRISSKATVRIETPIGDQAQFDWSEYDVEVNGRVRRVYCFAMILAACRKKAICFSLRCDAEAIYEAIQELFSRLGGITLELLIDNPKALVLEHLPKSEMEIRYNPQALLMARHLGTELNACPCYWPRKKGKIEKPFQFIQQQLIKGNTFSSMTDLNRRGQEFIAEWNQKKHTTTQRIPDDFYETEEKHALLPLPGKRFRITELKKRMVSNDSYVSIDASKYSVPVNHVGKTVLYRKIYGYLIEIYDKNEDKILSCESSEERHTTRRVDAHYETIAPKTSTSIPQIRRDFTAVFKHGANYLEHAGRHFDQPTHHARKILELLDLYEASVLDLFLAYAIENDKMDIKSFKKLLKEQFHEISNPGMPGQDSPAQNVKDTGANRQSLPAEHGQLHRECSYYENVGKEEHHEHAANQ